MLPDSSVLELSYSGESTWASGGKELQRKQSKECFNLKVCKEELTRLCVLVSLAHRSGGVLNIPSS